MPAAMMATLKTFITAEESIVAVDGRLLVV